MISIVGNVKSTLAKNSDFVLDTTVKKEACSPRPGPYRLYDRDARDGRCDAIALLDKRGFKEEDFALTIRRQSWQAAPA